MPKQQRKVGRRTFPCISLTSLETILYNESSVMAEEDVPRLLMVISEKAYVDGEKSLKKLEKMRKEWKKEIKKLDDLEGW